MFQEPPEVMSDDAALETTLLTALQMAIVHDTIRSLNDPANHFTAASESEPCKCYSNMKTAVRIVRGNPSRANAYVNIIRSHVTDVASVCDHVWHSKQIRKATHAYRKPRERVGDF